MTYTGLYTTLFAAPDMKEAQRFYSDWGLRKIKGSPSHSVFETKNGSRVELKTPNSTDLPPPAAPDMHHVYTSVAFIYVVTWHIAR